jgi:hypothetical protein
MSQTTPLARGKVTRADQLIISLEERDGLPPVVLVTWPAAASVASPYDFRNVASKVANLMAQATVRLSQIRRDRKL